MVERVRQALFKRGVKSIRSIGRSFRNFDSLDGNKKVEKEEFKVGLRENGVQDLSNRELDVKFIY